MFIVEINQIIGAKPLRISVNKSENQLQQQRRVQKWATTTTTTKCICEFELGLRREWQREKCIGSTRTHSRTHLQCECKLSSALSLSCSLRQLIAAAAIICSPLSSSQPLQRCQLGAISLLTWNFVHFIFILILLLQKRRRNWIVQIITYTAMYPIVCVFVFLRSCWFYLLFSAA